LANSGADLEALLRHGGFNQVKTATRYIDDVRHYKERTGNMISKSIIGNMSFFLTFHLLSLQNKNMCEVQMMIGDWCIGDNST